MHSDRIVPGENSSRTKLWRHFFFLRWRFSGKPRSMHDSDEMDENNMQNMVPLLYCNTYPVGMLLPVNAEGPECWSPPSARRVHSTHRIHIEY
jgi:hypothetical protein